MGLASAALRRVSVVLWCGLAAGIAGCGFPFTSLDALIASEEAPFLAGKQGDVIEIAKEDYPDGAVDPLAIFSPETSQAVVPTELAVRVDLATGDVTPITDPQERDAALAPPDLRPLETARWSARLSRDGDIVVTDRESGDETTYFADLPDRLGVNLIGLDGDWLVARITRFDSDAAVLVVIDLTTGEQVVVDHVAPNLAAMALRDGLLVFEAVPPFDPQNQPLAALGAPDTLDLLDLRTQARQTIVEDASRIDYQGVRFDGQQVVWAEPGERFGQERIVAYDIASGQTRTLLELTVGDEGNHFSMLDDFNSRAALVERVDSNFTDPVQLALNPGGFRQTVEYIVMPYDGEPVTILSFENTGVLNPLPGIQVLTDNFAAVLDRDQKTLVVYDLNTGQTRRITLFE